MVGLQNHIKVIFTQIHSAFQINEPLDHYLNRIAQSESPKFSIFKKGISLVERQEGFNILPTTYEVILDMEQNKLIYKIGNMVVFEEQYVSSALLKIFNDKSVSVLMNPDPIDIKKFLNAVKLISAKVDIGRQADLSEIFLSIQEGEIPVGRYYEKTSDGYHYMEVTNLDNAAVIKELHCPSSDYIIYALSGGGDFPKNLDINLVVYETVRKRIISLAQRFNKEVLMSLTSIETGIEDYNELLAKINHF